MTVNQHRRLVLDANEFTMIIISVMITSFISWVLNEILFIPCRFMEIFSMWLMALVLLVETTTRYEPS